MTPYFQTENVTLYHGDCLDLLQQMSDNTIDAVVCDPPYGLAFMGKKWDYDVPSEEIWKECLRVLKPGGHLLAFAGTRTQHRMAVRIEDAGFEIRDMIAWLYGSGFPKSLDVSKAIDKAARSPLLRNAPKAFLDKLPNNTRWDWIHGGHVPGRSWWERIKTELEGADGIEPEVLEFVKKTAGWFTQEDEYGVTAPVTDEAKEWTGWGTALKPAIEPLTWATKPLSVVPINDILQVENTIGSLICLSLSNVKNVELFLASSQNGLSAVSVSARLIAAVNHGVSCDGLSGLMAMFKSPETAKIILNTVELWNCILTANSQRQNTFTTSMAINLTTALRTFDCLILQIIQNTITPDEHRELGKLLSACIAKPFSSEPLVKSSNVTFAHDLVTLLTELRPASNAEASFISVAQIANTVLSNAITSLEEKVSPAMEPITVARKPLVGTVAANCQKYGTGAINVDGCRVETDDPPRVGNVEKSQSVGYGAATWQKSGTTPPLGRWPANVIHDGSEEVVELFPELGKSTGGRTIKRSGGGNVGSGKDSEKSWTNDDPGYGDSGSAARFFYCAKASRAERNRGCEDLPTNGTNPNNHPTVKPLALMEYLIKLVTREGQTILDPFAGSGSTLVAAAKLNRVCIGIEREVEYCEIIAHRTQLEPMLQMVMAV